MYQDLREFHLCIHRRWQKGLFSSGCLRRCHSRRYLLNPWSRTRLLICIQKTFFTEQRIFLSFVLMRKQHHRDKRIRTKQCEIHASLTKVLQQGPTLYYSVEMLKYIKTKDVTTGEYQTEGCPGEAQPWVYTPTLTFSVDLEQVQVHFLIGKL